MTKKRPFSKLKKVVDNLFDEKLKMEFCCNSYPIRGQWGNRNSIPRYYVKIGKEIIWDFPKDFDMKELPFTIGQEIIISMNLFVTILTRQLKNY